MKQLFFSVYVSRSLHVNFGTCFVNVFFTISQFAKCMFCYFDVCVFANKSRKMLCEHLLISSFALFPPKVPRTFSPRNYTL